MKEACSPIFAEVMAEKEQLKLEIEKQQAGFTSRQQQQQYKPLGLEDDLVVRLDPLETPGKCAWKVVVVPLGIFLLIIHAVESGWFADLLAFFNRFL